MKKIYTIYDKPILDKTARLTIDSWMENNYNVIIYVCTSNFKNFNPICSDPRI